MLRSLFLKHDPRTTRIVGVLVGFCVDGCCVSYRCVDLYILYIYIYIPGLRPFQPRRYGEKVYLCVFIFCSRFCCIHFRGAATETAVLIKYVYVQNEGAPRISQLTSLAHILYILYSI